MQDVLLGKLRNFDSDQHELEELIVLSAFGKTLSKEYSDLDLEEPNWLAESNLSIGKALLQRRDDMIAKEMRETEAALDMLKTNAERKDELRKKLDRLKKKQGVAA